MVEFTSPIHSNSFYTNLNKMDASAIMCFWPWRKITWFPANQSHPTPSSQAVTSVVFLVLFKMLHVEVNMVIYLHQNLYIKLKFTIFYKHDDKYIFKAKKDKWLLMSVGWVWRTSLRDKTDDGWKIELEVD